MDIPLIVKYIFKLMLIDFCSLRTPEASLSRKQSDSAHAFRCFSRITLHCTSVLHQEKIKYLFYIVRLFFSVNVLPRLNPHITGRATSSNAVV